MTTLELFAGFVAERGRTSPILPLLRRHVIDIVGCWIAASATTEGRAIAKFDMGNSALDKLAKNCALARLSEIDDIHLASMITAGGAVVPAVLTLGAEFGANRRDLADAIVVGYEAMIRLGKAIDGPSVLYRGIWPSYFAAPFGVAAAVARLLRLSRAQTAHALALALNLSSPNSGHQHGALTSRWLAFGLMARNGAMAALAAKKGFVGNIDLLETGFLANAYGLKPNLAALTENLGNRLVLEEVSFKPWCAARQTMAGAQAVREVLAISLKPAEITEAVVSIPQEHVKMVAHGVTPGDRASYLTSLPYQMALAAYAPQKAMDLKQSPKNTSRAIADFMAKVTVRGEAEFASRYPEIWPALLMVKTPSGMNEVQVNHVPGDPVRPFDDTQTMEKFRAIVAPVLGKVRAEKALKQALSVLTKNAGVKLPNASITRAARGKV